MVRRNYDTTKNTFLRTQLESAENNQTLTQINKKKEKKESFI